MAGGCLLLGWDARFVQRHGGLSEAGRRWRKHECGLGRVGRRGRFDWACSRTGALETESDETRIRGLSLYELLEVSEEVSLPEIKSAYRQLALRYHPDVCPAEERDECVKKFMQVQEAYDTLRDPNLRATYDFRLRNPRSAQGMTLISNMQRRSGQRYENPHEDWKTQWESQIRDLRHGRSKPGSWAARMREKEEHGGKV